ncbi:ArsR/SmtB family transcription factor [Jannaschia donghaensis]|uniref:HTH-type transcriptional regulator n=1 Tax=Jannaschia donghaensis TaxID=420998 RepID=A0A0M6YKG5_9RHOB|nr:metalloregulator ArsR/SmtB family transcription factor [Jannaschia donghaensis]CTQ50852.1 HTH-type transcriptional regulator [Jannaschia donghaensis]
MTYEAILTALADPTRRAVLDRLRGGALPVGRIADGLPVSRPAVSQHLKVLLEAGLVSMTTSGTRNHYALVSGGAAPLVDWLGDLHATCIAPDPVPGWYRSLTTRLSVAETWQLFCEDIAIWWPVARISLSAQNDGALPQVVVLDAKAGGRLREVLFDGTEGTWATVTAAQRPARIDLDWRLGTPQGSKVAVILAAEDGGARLTLRQDAESEIVAAMWDMVLERFAAAANASLSNF